MNKRKSGAAAKLLAVFSISATRSLGASCGLLGLLVFLGLFGLGLGANQASAQSFPTQQQLQQLQNLSEQERRQLLEQRSGANSGAASQRYEPEQIPPRGAGIDPNGQFQQGQQQGQQQGDRAESLQQEQAQREDRLRIEQQAPQREQDLEPFGYDLFAGAPTTFAPATNIPVPSSYSVGPGDTVIIQLYGQQNLTYELVVSREGVLMFPEIGPVSVNGLSFEEVRAQLQSIVSNQLIGQNASITMGPLRSIDVFVLGEAFRPGSYTVSSLSTMTNALLVSGGITDVGSLRTIRLMRSGETVTELDLYDLLLRGDTSGDARLQPGDVIFVPPVGRTVGIAGEVRRPAIYEIKNETAAAQVLTLAGGVMPTAFPAASRLERINERGERTLIDVNLSDNTSSTALADGDLIRINPVMEQLERVVMLEGHLQRPGGFQWRDNLRVSDVLPSIDAMLPNPDLALALIVRETLPTRRIELIRVALGEAIANPESAANLALQPRDQLQVFGASQDRRPQLESLLERLYEQSGFQTPPLVIDVTGNVRFPGEYPLVSGLSLSEAIGLAGGLNPESDLDNILIERRVDPRGTIAVERHSLDPQARGTEPAVALRERDKLIVFAANLSRVSQTSAAPQNTPLREALLFDTLVKLRAQASNGQPTEIVSVSGQVRFPGDYPLARGLTANELISMAGGLRESGDTSSVELTRFDTDPSAGREQARREIDLRASREIALSPFDRLVVRQIPNWTDNETVQISGEVNSPGTYSIAPNDTLSTLIERAGGLSNYADPRAGIFLRTSLAENEQRAIDQYRKELEQQLAFERLQGDDSSVNPAETAALLESLDEAEPTGRLVIDLPQVLAGSTDVLLLDGDQLLIPRTREEVTVSGEVRQPTSHFYDPGMRVTDYISSSGEFTQDADRRGVYVIRSSGEVVAFGGARWFFQRRSGVEPGDTIVVPKDLYRPDSLQIWSSVSQILFNISTTLLAIERVGN